MPSTPSSKSAAQTSGAGGREAGGPYYAWNTFVTEYDEHGIPTDKIEPGEPITQADLDVSDEEWESLVETGAVSEEEYPDLPAFVSPAEYQAQLDIHGAMEDTVAAHEMMLESATNPDTPSPNIATSEPSVVEEDADEKPAAKPTSGSSSK